MGGICPDNTATKMFWAEFSVRLAKASSGIVFWLTKGSSSEILYNRSSFFAKYEVPNLGGNKPVHMLVALYIHPPGQGNNMHSNYYTSYPS